MSPCTFRPEPSPKPPPVLPSTATTPSLRLTMPRKATPSPLPATSTSCSARSPPPAPPTTRLSSPPCKPTRPNSSPSTTPRRLPQLHHRRRKAPQLPNLTPDCRSLPYSVLPARCSRCALCIHHPCFPAASVRDHPATRHRRVSPPKTDCQHRRFFGGGPKRRTVPSGANSLGRPEDRHDETAH